MQQLSSDHCLPVSVWVCVALYTHAYVCVCEGEFIAMWLSAVPARCVGRVFGFAAGYDTCMSSQMENSVWM